MRRLMLCVLVIFISQSLLAGHPASSSRSLPPGLQKKVERGGELPPGWKKKLQPGATLDRDIYEHGEVIDHHSDGSVTVVIEDERLRLIESTMEIIDILSR